MSDKTTPLKVLNADIAVRSRLKVRIFHPTVTENLPSSSGQWTKWSAIVIDKDGQTALCIKRIFGTLDERAKRLTKHQENFPAGSVVVINPNNRSNQGCKGSPKISEYNSTSASTSLEITLSTVMRLEKDDGSIPKRPMIRKSLADYLKTVNSRRVNVCGVVRNVSAESIEAKNGKEARPYTVVEIIDDSGTGAHLSLWPPFNARCGSDDIGKYLSAYNLKLAVSAKGKQLQSTDDTVTIVLDKADNILEREDAMIQKADSLRHQQPSELLTYYEGGGTGKLTQGMLRLVCVKALALAAEVRGDLPESGFQLEGVYPRLMDAEEIMYNDRLWTKVSLSDASGQTSIFATEKALLSMSSLQKEKFTEACKDGTCHLHRSSLRVSRSLRTKHNGSAEQKDYVNLLLEDASPQFLCSVDSSASSKYMDSATFADAAAILPATLRTLRYDDDEGIQVILQAEQSQTVEALGGVTLLLQATCEQEPDHDHNTAIIRYNQMQDVMSGEKCDVICYMSLKCALKFLLKPGQFGIFHVTKNIKVGESTALLAEKVYLPLEEVSIEEAKSKFEAEIATSAGIVKLRRTLKRERSHLDPECEQEVKEAVFSLESPAKRMCSSLRSPPCISP